MSANQVFLSYASADRARARLIVRALEDHGWSVWWDTGGIAPGERFARVITQAIQAARVVVVLWSTTSVDSDWVMDEADDGKSRGILVPVLIDDVEIPRGFRQLQHAWLIDWSGASGNPEFQKFVKAIERLAPPARSAAADVPERSSLAQPVADSSAPPRLNVAVKPPAVNRPINLGFDGPVVDGLPAGWFNSLGYVSGVSLSYESRVVHRPEANGYCLELQKSTVHQQEFGSVMQRCAATRLAGQTVRFQGELKSEAVLGWAGLWLRADGAQEGNLFFDNMHRRPIRGTTEWTPYHIDAQLPTATRWLNFGVVLSGQGRIWVDNCRVLVWDEAGWRDW